MLLLFLLTLNSSGQVNVSSDNQLSIRWLLVHGRVVVINDNVELCGGEVKWRCFRVSHTYIHVRRKELNIDLIIDRHVHRTLALLTCIV
jgi:hypothetical protein